jgi:hypothetical protein
MPPKYLALVSYPGAARSINEGCTGTGITSSYAVFQKWLTSVVGQNRAES